MDPAPEDLMARQEAVVREHMASENELRFDDTLATFPGTSPSGPVRSTTGSTRSRPTTPPRERCSPINATRSGPSTPPSGPWWWSSICWEPTPGRWPERNRRGGPFAVRWSPSSSSRANGSCARGCTSTRGRSTASWGPGHKPFRATPGAHDAPTTATPVPVARPPGREATPARDHPRTGHRRGARHHSSAGAG